MATDEKRQTVPLTNDALSLWELAHRLAGRHPASWRTLGLAPEVKDAIRLLLNEILSLHLASSLIMEKRPPDSDLPKAHFVRTHLDAIYDCIAGHSFPRRLLKGIEIERWDFADWCRQSGQPLPAFWFDVDHVWPKNEPDRSTFSENVEVQDAERPKPSATVELKQQVRDLAVQIWAETPRMRIAAVARGIHDRNVALHYQARTVQGWIRDLAPEGIRNRPGRPRKNSDSE